MANTVYLCFALIGLVLVLIPLPWHLNAWNSGTCLFMIWTALGCLVHFVDGIIWLNNVDIYAKVWCDISSKLIVGFSVALPCSSLCINRRLYKIATVSQVLATRAEKLHAVLMDIAIGVGIPVLVMALHYIVQGHRFDIFENIGCWPSTVNMIPSYFLVWIWPVLIGLVSMAYCCLSLRAFWQRRKQFNYLLAANHHVSANRYFRLMALATADIITTVPFSVYFIYLNLTAQKVQPWVSWSDTKWHFSRIDVYPAIAIDLEPTIKVTLELNLWLFPACAFLFFAFFGLAEEARLNYRKWLYFVATHLGISRATQSSLSTLPYHVKIKSVASFGTNASESNWSHMSSPVDPSLSTEKIHVKDATSLNDTQPIPASSTVPAPFTGEDELSKLGTTDLGV